MSEATIEDIRHGLNPAEVEAMVLDEAEAAYDTRETEMGAENMRLLERLLLLQTIDRLWVEHLTAMDEMRQGIGLQAYGQQDPLVAYKREAHDMWEQLLVNIRQTIARAIYHVALAQQPVQQAPQPQLRLHARRSCRQRACATARRCGSRRIGYARGGDAAREPRRRSSGARPARQRP